MTMMVKKKNIDHNMNTYQLKVINHFKLELDNFQKKK